MNNSKKKEYLIALFTSLILLCVSWMVCGINFETNDDTRIMMYVTGANTGAQESGTVFCNILWGALLSFLYRLNESVPWYIITYMVFLWAVFFIICNCCIRLFVKNNLQDDTRARNVPVISGILVFCILYFSVFFYYSVFFQFTTVAALCGLGAILLMILFPKGNKIVLVSFFYLLFFSEIIRPITGYLITVAFLIICLFMFILRNKPNHIYLAIVGVTQISTYAVNNIYEHINGWTAFREYHTARAIWKDYPHISFDNNPPLYERLGWTKQLYNLVNRWFFMDKRVNTAAFESFNDANTIHCSFNLEQIKAFLRTPELGMTFVILGIVSVGIVIYCLLKHKHKNSSLLLSAGLLTAIIILYFLFRGRLPYRVSFSIIILFMLPAIFLSLQYVNGIKYKPIILIVSIIIVAYSCFGQKGLMRITYLLSKDPNRIEGIEIKKDIEKYAVDHPGNIYIYDYSLTMSGSPFITYSRGKPYNLMFWGGSCMYSPLYYDQLVANGLKEFYSDKFFNNNIYFMGNSKPDTDLIEYMQDEFSKSVSIEIVDVANNFIVYRFNR